MCQNDVKKHKAKLSERKKQNAPDIKNKLQGKSAVGKPNGPKKQLVASKAKEIIVEQPEVVDRKLPGSRKEEKEQQEVVDHNIFRMFKRMPLRKKSAKRQHQRTTNTKS